MSHTTNEMPRAARVVLHCITLVLLLSSMLLTLLVLLMPTYGHSLSMFSLEPVGRDIAPLTTSGTLTNGTSGTVSPPSMPSSGLKSVSEPRPDISDIAVAPHEDGDAAVLETQMRRGVANASDIAVDGSRGRTMHAWLGMHGPSVFVGAMQICSKADDEADVSCTSASQGAYHAAFLPYNLQDPLLKLPSAPPVPVLLLVGGTAALLATVVYIYGLVIVSPLAALCRDLWRRANVLRRHPNLSRHLSSGSGGSRADVRPAPDSPNSMTTLVNPPSGEITRPKRACGARPHLAFFVLAATAFGLMVATSVLEILVVHKAKKRWNGDDAARLGMKFEIGVLAYLIVCLPIFLLLAIIISLIPVFYTRFRSSRSHHQISFSIQRVDSGISMEKISPPQHLDATITQVPAEWTRISLDRPSRPAPARIDEIVGRTRRESVRESWRSAISHIGFAV